MSEQPEQPERHETDAQVTTAETTESGDEGHSRLAERGVLVGGRRLAAAMSDAPRSLLPRVPLIVLPEVGFVWRDYLPLLERFAGERRVFALDWPGFGASAKPPEGDAAYSLTGYLEALCGWLDGLGIARGVLAANGLGAAVALRYAAEHPRRVLGLALLAPVGFSTGARSSRLVVRLLGSPTLLRRVEPLATSLSLGPDSPSVRAAHARHRTLRSAADFRLSVAALSALWRDVAAPAARAQLAEAAAAVAAPAIVLRGALDPLVTAPEAHAAAAAIGGLGGHGALEVTLPEAGHLPFLQQPQRCFAALDGLLGTAELAAAQMA
jgi:pimeloyl-ACP methyl ester carboxylesterase